MDKMGCNKMVIHSQTPAVPVPTTLVTNAPVREQLKTAPQRTLAPQHSQADGQGGSKVANKIRRKSPPPLPMPARSSRMREAPAATLTPHVVGPSGSCGACVQPGPPLATLPDTERHRGNKMATSGAQQQQHQQQQNRILPCESLLQSGAAVALVGACPRLDGQVGRLASTVGADNTAEVMLAPVLGSACVRVSAFCFRPLPKGTPVIAAMPGEPMIAVTPGTESHGHPALISEFRNGQYTVSFRSGAPSSVVAPHMVSPSRLLDVPLKPSGGPSPVETVADGSRNAESDCCFVDSDGLERRFWLSLPRAFAGSSTRSWPLLVFLHGAGGGTLLHWSKRAPPTAGSDYAAEHFVVISPVCEWTWKSPPQAWVVELVAHLAAAAWCDAGRVSVTGCSMGGMGCWELAAAAPWLFAAIAPVAAYHQAERRQALAEALEMMPVFAVQSPHDECCNFKAEQQIWQALSNRGNVPVVKQAKGLHLTVFAEAYSHSTELLEFLAAQRRTL